MTPKTEPIFFFTAIHTQTIPPVLQLFATEFLKLTKSDLYNSNGNTRQQNRIAFDCTGAVTTNFFDGVHNVCLNTVGPPIWKKKHFEMMVMISEGDSFFASILSCRLLLSNYFVRQMYGDCFALSAGMVFNDIRLAAMPKWVSLLLDGCVQCFKCWWEYGK